MAPPTGKRVAVVGSGPAGLTVAGDLRRAWATRSTIFEALHKPGGVLVYGIPEFRLPKAIVDAEVDTLEAAWACEIRLQLRRRQDCRPSTSCSQEGFDAVFIGTGAGLPMFMDIPGENLDRRLLGQRVPDARRT